MKIIKVLENIKLDPEKPGWIPQNASDPVSEEAFVDLRIEDWESCYYLFVKRSTTEGEGTDFYFTSIEEALSWAEVFFGVTPENWNDA